MPPGKKVMKTSNKHSLQTGLRNSAIILMLCNFFTACSPINSVQPFDASQAEALLDQGSLPRPAKQMVALNLPRQQAWQKTNEFNDRLSSPVMLIPVNQSVVSWQESVKTRSRFYGTNFTTKNVLQNQIADTKTHCQVVQEKILTHTAQAMTYRLTNQQCDNQNAMIQVGKIFNGADAMYLIYYSANPDQVTPKQIALMTQVIANARLVENPSYH